MKVLNNDGGRSSAKGVATMNCHCGDELYKRVIDGKEYTFHKSTHLEQCEDRA